MKVSVILCLCYALFLTTACSGAADTSPENSTAAPTYAQAIPTHLAATVSPTEIVLPITTVRSEPPVPVAVPMSPEITQGIDAIVYCAGMNPDYWLEYGPPPMNAEIVDCLNSYLEAN